MDVTPEFCSVHGFLNVRKNLLKPAFTVDDLSDRGGVLSSGSGDGEFELLDGKTSGLGLVEFEFESSINLVHFFKNFNVNCTVVPNL